MGGMFLDRFSVVLGEGSMYERLRRGGSNSFDPHIAHAGMLYDRKGRDILAATHREYIDIGQRYGLPMVVGTPTWRACAVRVEKSIHRGKAVNGDASRFMRELRDAYGPDAAPILIAGVIGPIGDAYRPEQAPDAETAVKLHRPQIVALSDGGIDFFKAQTLPHFAEARGIAQMFDQSGLPYILSFVIRSDGRLLDGTPLAQAMDAIDNETRRPPAGYIINCVHASVFTAALSRIFERNSNVAARVIGIDANTSAKTPDELDNLDELETEAPADFGCHVAALRREFGITYLGGCCGTSTEHIAALAKLCTGQELEQQRKSI